MRMKEKEKILQQHPYKIWEGKDGKWYTYLSDENKGRVKKSSKELIENIIISYYKGIQKEKRSISFKKRYNIWVQRQLDCKVSNNTVNKYNCDYKRFFQDSSIELEEISSITDEMLYSFLVNRIKQKNYLIEQQSQCLEC